VGKIKVVDGKDGHIEGMRGSGKLGFEESGQVRFSGALRALKGDEEGRAGLEFAVKLGSKMFNDGSDSVH
jgi:hypothetical protein